MKSEDQSNCAIEPTIEGDDVLAQRRAALKRLGKFGIYASPVVLGMVSQEAVAGSVIILNPNNAA
jgi:hypothetical protein